MIKLNIMKLELKHLAVYLPYGLRIKLDDLNTKIMHPQFNNSFEININSVVILQNKPILRPLSDLNKELMSELFSLIDESDWIDLKGKFDEDELVFQIDDGWNYVLSCEDIIEFHFSNNSFGIFDCYNTESLFVSNQYELMEWLFEHHFDVFGLIDAGLAIDINTLN